jgi:hypothetical protein
MYICCAFVGAIKDPVRQNARCNSKKNTIGFSLRLAILAPAPPLIGTHENLNFSAP